MSSPPHTVESINSEDGVSCLREDWDRLSLASEFPNVFMTFDWFQAWYRRFAQTDGPGKRRPNLLVIKQDGVVTGISPLIRTVASRFGFVMRRLQFVAREQEWDYNDLVLGNNAEGQTSALVGFLSKVSKDWDLVDLRNLRDTGGTIAGIESSLAAAGLSYRILPEEERSPYMLINGPWSEMMIHHSRSTRRVFRKFTEMTREGLRVRIVENPHEEPGLLDSMITLEAQKQVGGEPSPPFLGVHAEVFQSLFNTLGPQGWISVVLMEWKDRMVAWQLLYRCGNQLWGYLTAYSQEFSLLSPGTMLIPAAIDYGYAHGFEEFDFLNGEESYKMRWANGFHQTYRLLIWNRRVKSRLCAFAYLKRRVRPPAPAEVENPA